MKQSKPTEKTTHKPYVRPYMRQLSVRLTEEEYDYFNRACHADFKSMAEVAVSFIRAFIEKRKKEKEKAK